MKRSREQVHTPERREFYLQLPSRLAAIRRRFRALIAQAWSLKRQDRLLQDLHRLAEQAAGHGLPGVAEAARILELGINHQGGSAPPLWRRERLQADMLHLDTVARQELAGPLHGPAGGERAAAPLVYVLDEDRVQAHYLEQLLGKAGYRVGLFFEAGAFARALATELPVAVVMDRVFTEGHEATALSALQTRGRAGVALIVLSARTDIEARLGAQRAGAAHFLSKPLSGERLLRLLSRWVRIPSAQTAKVLLLGADHDELARHAAILREAGMEVCPESEVSRLLERLASFEPDVLVFDTRLPGASGPELVALLRADEELPASPVLFLCSEADAGKPHMVRELRGAAFLTKPVSADALLERVARKVAKVRAQRDQRLELHQLLYEFEREHVALNHHAIVSIADARGRIVYVNERFCQISGYTREELLGQNHRIIKSEVQSDEFFHTMWQQIANGRVWQGEICNRRKDGAHYWVASTIVPYLDAQGKPYQYVSIRTDITRVKRLEQEAQVSAERLRRSQIFANIGTWDWNIQSGDLFWSERIAALFGYPIGELETTYENFLAAVHPDDRSMVSAAVDACVWRGAEYNIEHRVVWPDGQVRWVQEKGDVVRDAQGGPVHMLGVIIDIHDRKMAEEALNRFKTTLDMTKDCVFMFEPASLKFFYANQGAMEQIGYSTDELMDMTPVDIKPEYSERQFRALLQRLIEGREEVTTFETLHRHKDGHDIPVEISLQYIEPQNESPRFVAIVRNISERKQAEEDLKIFHQIFESSEQGIGITDAQGQLIYTNKAHDRIHGYDFEQTAGRHFSMFFSEQTLAWAPQEIFAAIEAGKSWSGLLPVLRPDGSEIMTAANVGFVADANGAPKYLFNIMSDYTKEQRRQQQIAEAKEAAERASQAKSEFLSSMSHELRTPMNAILGFGQILEIDESLGEEQHDSVQEILKAGHHLLELINEVLDLAKIESGRIELSLEPVELKAVVAECFSLMAPFAAKHQVVTHCPEFQACLIRADRTRLKQVLLNLLSNAIKYNRAQGRAELELEARPGGFVRITIADSGMGIAADRLDELFQPFNRLDAEGSAIEGTGIGLAITHRLVEMMGARIGVESERGQGSRFWVEFPLAGPEDG